jgi:hypothetical protein
VLRWLVALAIAVVAVLIHYAWRAPPAIRGRGLPAALRFTGALLLAALALDAPFGTARRPPPLVALDASASWRRAADSAPWSDARRRALATRADTMFLFGDSLRVATGDLPPPRDAASRVRPAVDRALASGRRLIVLTDGEVDDPDALDGLPAGSRIEVIARPARPDAGLLALDLPRSAVSGDTLEVRVTVTAGPGGSRAGTLRLLVEDRALAEQPLEALAAGATRALSVSIRPTGQGAVVVRAIIAVPGDAEARNDTLAAALDLSPSAAAVLVSTAPDYDARFAVSVLRGAVRLPTRAYYRVAPGVWRADPSLAPVSEADVRRAVQEAPLLVLHGDTTLFGPPRALGRGALLLFAPPRDAEQGGEEWFATGAPASPVSPALAGIPWDSLPPLDVAAEVPAHEWAALETRRARRLEQRFAVVGSERPRRSATVVAGGLWRWQFRGGVAADAYAALLGGLFDWLAAERADRRAALPDLAAVREGEPVRWRRGAAPDSVVVASVVRRGGPPGGDSLTLRFGADRNVVESAPLAAGIYDVRVRGGAAVLVVNPSREWLPRAPVARTGARGGAVAAGAAPGLRRFAAAWLLAVAALCAEWVLRRRAGLR